MTSALENSGGNGRGRSIQPNLTSPSVLALSSFFPAVPPLCVRLYLNTHAFSLLPLLFAAEFSPIMEKDNDVGGAIIDATDISEHEKLVMEGDLVGNTAYSAKWILKTLLKLSQVDSDERKGWSDDLETDLCFLWDMTTEKDIVDFLIENNFLSIAEYLLKIAEHHRMKEIIVGIIGNMCSQPDALLHISNMSDLIEVILILLTSPDTETLIQVMRVLQASMWDIKHNTSSKWREILVQCKYLGQSLIFILESSINESLLTSALSLLQSMTNAESDNGHCLLHDLLEIEQLISALKSSFHQLVPERNEDYSVQEQENINIWLDIVSNLFQKQQTTIHYINYTEILDILITILRREMINLIPLEETNALSIYKCIENIHWFQQKKYEVDLKNVCIIFNIMEKLNSALMDDPNNETVGELLHYIERYISKLLNQHSMTEITKLFEYCPQEVKDYLINFITDNGLVDSKCKLTDIEHI